MTSSPPPAPRGYPLAEAALKALLAEKEAENQTAASIGSSSFRLGPSVLRAPPAAVRRPPPLAARPDASDDGSDDGAEETPPTDDLLGELLDMVLVGADDADSGLPEVHLQFKAEVFGGLHLKLVKRPASAPGGPGSALPQTGGLEAFFIVKDAASRRAVAAHVEALVAHLKERGFQLFAHHLQIQGQVP